MDPDKPLEGVRLLALQVIPFREPEPWLLAGLPSSGGWQVGTILHLEGGF